jgi:ribose-phosphate pyrophosphokinase
MERINGSNLKKLVVTDTLPLRIESPKIEVESVAQLFAEAIKRSYKHQSISSLFDVDKG